MIEEHFRQVMHIKNDFFFLLSIGTDLKKYWRKFNKDCVVVSHYYHCMESNAHINFIDPVEVFVCDHHGCQYALSDHGIVLNIPKGSIPENHVLHFEIAVALYGPFSFPRGKRPVSPILWLCPQESIEFSVPIQVTLPHFLSCQDQELSSDLEIKVFKADHNEYSVSNTYGNISFNFNELKSVQPLFNRKECQGLCTFETTHCCFLCIAANQCPDLARKAGFCFSRFDYVSLSSTYVVNFCVSFFLPSCLKVR